MATLTTKTVVCDEGLAKCDNSSLHRVRLTIDGKTTTQILCDRHLAPFLKLREKMGGSPAAARGRVFTPEEIAAKKATTRKR